MTQHDEQKPELSPVVNHETTDAQAGPVVKFLIFLAVFSIVIAALMIPLYQYFEEREATDREALYPMAIVGEERPLPPPPRLQLNPFQDYKALRAEQRQLLTTYGWINKDAGIVRVPIDRAIDVIAERGLPYQPEPLDPIEDRGLLEASGGQLRPATPTGESSATPAPAAPPPPPQPPQPEH